MAKSKADVSQFRGLIVQRAAVYYPRLPACWKASIDFSDFVQMAFLLVAQRLHQHDAKKGALSTHVYNITECCFAGFLEKINYKKRAAEVVSLNVEDDEGNTIFQLASKLAHETMIQSAEAAVAVKRLHQSASLDLLTFLDENFFHQTRVVAPKSTNQKFQALRREFQSLAAQHGVTIELYRAAIASHHERAQLLEQLYR